MTSNLGWADPVWRQLYGDSPAPPPVITPAAIDDTPVHYLDQLQAAAAAGQDINLSDLPGFQPNLIQPTDG
jgi:hypothetical protein